MITTLAERLKIERVCNTYVLYVRSKYSCVFRFAIISFIFSSTAYALCECFGFSLKLKFVIISEYNQTRVKIHKIINLDNFCMIGSKNSHSGSNNFQIFVKNLAFGTTGNSKWFTGSIEM